MFGNEIDLENPISNSLIMALIDKQKEKNTLPKIIQDKVDSIFSQRIKFISFNTIQEFFDLKQSDNSNNNQKGIINIKWIHSITNEKPSVILLFYHMTDNNNLL